MNPLLLPLREIAQKVHQGELRPRDLVAQSLRQAEALQPQFKTFITLAPELAQQQTAALEARLVKGERPPLAGVPFAVKDLFDVQGLPTTAGSAVLRNNIAQQTAHVVERLIAAGAILLGKLSLHEFAFGFSGQNPHYGDCVNPWAPDRMAGGSSSGSGVAVATGICPLTLGSDTGGSIRMPAACCGITGLKPTYGRVSRHGVLPLSWSMDHIGPMTRTAEDAALALQVMAGRHPEDEATTKRPVPDYLAELRPNLKGVRIGVMHAWFGSNLTDDVATAYKAALDKLVSLGAVIQEVNLPYLPEVVGAHRAIIFPEASSYHRPLLAEHAAEYGAEIRPLLQGGLFISAVEYLQAQRARRKIRQAWLTEFANIDALATPTLPLIAPQFTDQMAELPGGPRPLVRACLDFTLPFNFSGQPAISIPCGFGQGIPIGLQLVGKPFGESTLFRIAHQFQRDSKWHLELTPAAQSLPG